MAGDDKKYTVDDILSEYDYESPEEIPADSISEPEGEESAAGSSEKEPSSPEEEKTEEYDNYEDCEEQDLSEKDFAQEPMFTPAGLFDSNPVSEEQAEADEENEDSETSEEIFADENDGDENIEPEEELLEEAEPETNEENVSVEEDSPENASQEENEIPENSGEARTWAENGIPDEITDIDVPEETEDNIISKENKEETSGDKPEEKPEEKIPEEPEDVNDKWLIRFAKGIFPVKGDSVGEVIRKIIFLVALIVFIGAGIMLLSTLIQSNAAQKVKDEAQSIITTTVATYIDENGNVVEIAPTEEEMAQHRFDVAEYYKGINPDYVGYLEVEGCEIYEPVVQGGDNDKYLRTNISGGYNKAGTVFMDYRCTFTQDYESPNVVLYGHNQEDGTMFGNLKWYKQDVEFYKEHPTVKLSSESQTGEYLIYGFFVTHVYEKQDSNGEVFHYHDYIETLNDEYTFNWYMKQVQRRNQIVSPVDVEFGDRLLCLSTCSNEFTDSRFVVFARKLREGETVDDYDFSKTYMNPNAIGVDWDAIITGDPTYAPETDVIEDIEEETEAVTTRAKSNNKKNSGSGSKSNGEPSIAPPPAETAATTVPETTTKKKTTTTTTTTTVTETSESETETEETQESETDADTGSETSETDDSGQEGSETEAPDQEGEQTETASVT